MYVSTLILLLVPVKAGMCPAVDPEMAGICIQQCNDDGGCDGDKKCCSNGCGNVCVDPVMAGRSLT